MKKITFAAFFLLTLCLGNLQYAVAQNKDRGREVRVEMVTTEGRMVFVLFNDTPLHRDNFLKLVKEHTYDSLLFHRVIGQFMIQGGDPQSRHARPGQMLGEGSLGYTVPAEFRKNHFHQKGALCAARLGDNVNPNKESSSSQFYIVQGQVWDDKTLDMMAQRYRKVFSAEQRKVYTTVGGTPHLDGDYTVFGQLVEGMDVVDKIAAVRVDGANRPVKDVRILSVKVIK
ncbi:MAG: peptidylprolyl isomerase [Bacteroidales bacterium]|nr:peptidylprolyl isomerase [Bacteroidales bacterium]